MPFDVAAGMVINYQTAHLALVRRGRIQPGEAVLVHGAAGGVGTAAIQVAKAAGAGVVIAVASDDERRRVATQAGADIALDPAGDWVAEVRAATGGRGADLVVDPVGGDRSTRACAARRRRVACSSSGSRAARSRPSPSTACCCAASTSSASTTAACCRSTRSSRRPRTTS